MRTVYDIKTEFNKQLETHTHKTQTEMKQEIKNAVRLIIIQSDQSVSRQNIKLEDKVEEMHGSLKKKNNENKMFHASRTS